jgi:hypothetical protein
MRRPNLRVSLMAAHGVQVQHVMTDNAFAYRISGDIQDALAGSGPNKS